MKKNRKWICGIILLCIPLIYLTTFFFYPIGVLLEAAFTQVQARTLPDFNWGIIPRSFFFTLYQALLSTGFTLLIGIPAAFLFAKYKFSGKQFLKLLSTLPFILPTVVTAAAFNTLLAPRGWINLAIMAVFGLDAPIIQIQNSLTAIILAHVFYNTSIVIRVFGGAWSRLDPKLENAALTLGAKPLTAFRRIIFPQLLPSLLSSVLLVFLFDFTSFGVVLMLGGPRFATIEVEIFIQTMHLLNLPLSGILSLIQLIFTMVVSGLIVRTSGESALPVLTRINGLGKKKIEKFSEKALLVGMILVLLTLFGLPVFGLIFRSFTFSDIRIGGSTLFSLAYYRSLFEDSRQSIFFVPPAAALANSLIFASMTSILTLSLALLLVFGLRIIGKAGRLLEIVLLLPMGTSAVTLGLGFFVAFSRTSQTTFIYYFLIPAAHSLVALPFVMRIIQPALATIPKNLQHAAQSLGAAPGKVWRYIEMPLIRPAIFTSLIYAIAISLGEFGATSFISRPDIPTMPTAIFRLLNFPGGSNYGQAIAMSVIILVTCAIGISLLERIQVDHYGKRTEYHAAD